MRGVRAHETHRADAMTTTDRRARAHPSSSFRRAVVARERRGRFIVRSLSEETNVLSASAGVPDASAARHMVFRLYIYIYFGAYDIYIRPLGEKDVTSQRWLESDSPFPLDSR